MVYDGIPGIFGHTRAAVTVGNNYNYSRAKSDDAVAADVQMTGAKYCIRPMEYTGNGSMEVVHFERRFEGKGFVLDLLV